MEVDKVVGDGIEAGEAGVTAGVSAGVDAGDGAGVSVRGWS